MVSIRTCWVANSGIIWVTITPISAPSRTTATAIVQVSPASSRNAIRTPPTIMIGAATIMNAVIITSCWICCTSLVVRVIRLGAPNWATSRAE